MKYFTLHIKFKCKCETLFLRQNVSFCYHHSVYVIWSFEGNDWPLNVSEPDHDRAYFNKNYYEDMLARQGEDPMTEEQPAIVRKMDEYQQSSEFTSYEALCRGDHAKVCTEDFFWFLLQNDEIQIFS